MGTVTVNFSLTPPKPKFENVNPSHKGGFLRGPFPEIKLTETIVVNGAEVKSERPGFLLGNASICHKPNDFTQPGKTPYASVLAQLSPTRRVLLKGFGPMADVVAKLEAGKVYHFIGRTQRDGNYTNFVVESLATLGAQTVTQPAASAPAQAEPAAATLKDEDVPFDLPQQ